MRMNNNNKKYKLARCTDIIRDVCKCRKGVGVLHRIEYKKSEGKGMDRAEDRDLELRKLVGIEKR